MKNPWLIGFRNVVISLDRGGPFSVQCVSFVCVCVCVCGMGVCFLCARVCMCVCEPELGAGCVSRLAISVTRALEGLVGIYPRKPKKR